MIALLAIALFAQVAGWPYWESGYVTDHPGATDKVVVAVHEGLFTAIARPGCEDVPPNSNVTLWRLNSAQNGDVFVLDSLNHCVLAIETQESPQACYQTAGQCDIDGTEGVPPTNPA